MVPDVYWNFSANVTFKIKITKATLMGISYNRSFGAINGYTTETYESLHKEYVKIPYRLSNKKDIEIQIMKTVSINI